MPQGFSHNWARDPARFEPQLPFTSRYSPVREPWRVLRSSLAIQFTSDRMKHWSPENLSDFAKRDILSALEARWAAHLANAEFQSALFDLVWDAGKIPVYQLLKTETSDSQKDRCALLRQMALVDGPLSDAREEILDVLAWYEPKKDAFAVFPSGFIEVREKKSGQIIVSFQLGRTRKRLTCEEVRSRAVEVCRDLASSTDILRQVRRRVVAH